MRLHEIQEAMTVDMDKPLNHWERFNMAANGLVDVDYLTLDDLEWIYSAFIVMAEELEIGKI